MSNPHSDNSQQTVQESSARPAVAGRDPLESLHKMSRTAGLGSTDYVAVNTTSVAALLLGMASGLAVLGPILLILPVATVVLAIMAIRQIRRSAGTQTGTLIAILGLLIAAGCVAFIGGRHLLHARQIRAEQDTIIQLIERLGQEVNKGNYDAAWDFFGERYKEKRKKEDFVNQWKLMQASPIYGQIQSMRWNGILDVQTDTETGTTFARGVVLIDLPEGRQDRRESLFRKDEQQGWVFEDMEGIVQPQTGTPRRAMPRGS